MAVGGAAHAADLGPSYTVEQIQANMYAAQAFEVLQGGGEFTESQLELSRVLYDKALSFDPTSSELWRLRLELADNMRDTDKQVQAMRQIVKLDRKDDVIQLRLIRTLIETRMQTAEERMAGMAAILKSKGGRLLSEALRSRLASDIAGYAYELGDRGAVKKWLRIALTYDKTTNSDALKLVYQIASENNASDKVLAKTFLDLMKSDILNADYRKQLSTVLINERMFGPAVGQLGAEMFINNSTGGVSQDQTIGLVYRYTFGFLLNGRLKQGLARINELHSSLMKAAITAEYGKIQKAATEADEAPDYTVVDQEAVAKGVELPLNFEILRLAIMKLAENSEQREEHIVKLTERIDKLIELGSENVESLETDLAWLVCFYGEDHAGLDAMIKKVEGHKEPNKGMIACLKGWALLAKNELAGAREALLPYKDQLPFARLGLAQIDKENENSEAYHAGLQAVIEMDPNGLSALSAIAGLARDKQIVKSTELGKTYNTLLNKMPAIARLPMSVKGKKIAMQMKMSSKRYVYLEPHVAVVRIRNNSTIPMSLGGEGSTLSNQMMIYAALPGIRRPIGVVANMGRRLVLKPYESVEVKVPMDWNTVGRAAISYAGRVFEYSAQGVYAPVISASGSPRPGVLGDHAVIRLIAKQNMLPTMQNIASMTTNLSSSDELVQYTSLAWLGRVLPRFTPQEGLDPDDPNLEKRQKERKALADAGKKFLKVYNGLDADGKAWVAGTIMIRPEGDLSYLSDVYDALGTVDDLHASLSYMIIQSKGPDESFVNRALRSDNQELVKVTGWVKEMLTKRGEAIAKMEELRAKAKASQEAAGE